MTLQMTAVALDQALEISKLLRTPWLEAWMASVMVVLSTTELVAAEESSGPFACVGPGMFSLLSLRWV
jgi:hypothetical protein